MRTEPFTRQGETLIPGVNVDVVDIPKGALCAKELGYDDPQSQMVVEYGLQLWARGEEGTAQRHMVAYGIDLTSVYVILAHAIVKKGELT